jgi:hypothetical protein
MQNIHFKVAANNSFRRFTLPDVTLASLKTQVASLFGINDLNGWSIKYKDEENQMVTITSDEELFLAVQHGGKMLRLEISFPSAEKHGNSSSHNRHEGRREVHKARLAVRLNQKQERLRERLASLNPDENPRCKAQASKIEATIASISMELESLNLNEKDKEMPDSSVKNDASVELVNTGANADHTKHTDRKIAIKCNKVPCLIDKQERVREKLAKLGEETENPRKQAKIAKLKEKLAAITAKLEGMEKDTPASSPVPVDLKVAEKPADPSSGIPNSEDANKLLVQEVKSKFFLMKRELHQDRMQVISLMKTLKALRVISRHGVSAGISLDVNQLAQTEVSLGLARDQMAAKKLVIQQQKDLLALMKSQLGHGKNKKGKKDKEEKLKEKEEKNKDKVKRGRVEKSEKWKLEKKLRDEKRQGKHHRRHRRGGRRFEKAEENMDVTNTSSDSEKLEY